ncbi:16792_t:CDS:2 [Funneliformis geosporum]|nr:16792_t:CDS:2 [Funneliformis geosporum]
MTSKLPASPSEIYADDIKVFQLKALLLNFLRNTSKITDEHILKLNPYHFCDKEILALLLHSFTEKLALAFEEKRTEVTTHNQAISLIAYVEEIPELSNIIDDTENDDDGNNNHSSQNKVGLLHELSTPIKRETTETNNEDKTYQEEIHYWYYCAERFEKSVKDVKDNDKRVKDQQART